MKNALRGDIYEGAAVEKKAVVNSIDGTYADKVNKEAEEPVDNSEEPVEGQEAEKEDEEEFDPRKGMKRKGARQGLVRNQGNKKV